MQFWPPHFSKNTGLLEMEKDLDTMSCEELEKECKGFLS